MKAMTPAEIRKTVAPMIIWMVDATIRVARKAVSGKDICCRYPKETPDYNKPEVEMASAILFRTFDYCEADLRKAIIQMPDSYDGFTGSCRNYFDCFIETLGNGNGVMLRESDWTLERL